MSEYARHYNGHRPHQARHHKPPLNDPGQPSITAPIKRTQAVGGLISEYRGAGRRLQEPLAQRPRTSSGTAQARWIGCNETANGSK